MSLKEALNEAPLPRERRILGGLNDNRYEMLVFERGKEVLRQAGILDLLSELSTLIYEKHSDVQLDEFEFQERDQVSIMLRWDVHEVAEPGGGTCSAIIVRSRPTTSEIEVSQGISEFEVLTEEQWRSREILEDAIARAYHNPVTYGNEPIFMG